MDTTTPAEQPWKN